MNIDLIIPALNEAANINALFDALDGLPIRRVVLADNGSIDGTADMAAQHGATVVVEPHRGYGAACLKAIEWLRQNDPPEVVVFLDADLADDPSSLPKLLGPIERREAEIVIGSRVKLAEPGALNLPQRIGGALACFLMWILAGKRFTDLGPFRAVRWETLMRLNMTDRTWGWTVELQMKAAMLKIPTVEVNVPYRCRRHGRSKISGTVRGVFAAGTKIIWTIVALRWNRRSLIRDSDVS